MHTNAMEHARPPEPPMEAPPESSSGRIRILDGNSELLEALERALRSEGYDCRNVDGEGSNGEVLLEVRPAAPPPQPQPPPGEGPVRLDEVIRRHVLQVFHATRDNVTRTAMALGISRVALRRRLREYGAKPPASS
jgi:DNA-binding NtrC family response regulator